MFSRCDSLQFADESISILVFCYTLIDIAKHSLTALIPATYQRSRSLLGFTPRPVMKTMLFFYLSVGIKTL